MIPEESLTGTQRQYLEGKYGLDLEGRNQLRRNKIRSDRISIAITLLLASGLYWEGTTEVMASFVWPFGIVSWCLVSVSLLGSVTLWIISIREARLKAIKDVSQDDEVVKNAQRNFFRRYVSVTQISLMFWVKCVGLGLVVLASWATDRPFLAIGWVLAFIFVRSNFSWGNSKVSHELEMIERAAQLGNPNNHS